MADVFTKKKRSEVMSKIRGKNNRTTELKMIALFRDQGITGWRRGSKLPGKPDFVFPKKRIALFVDGCYWHNCPIHGRIATSNQDYWSGKMERNKKRDRLVSRTLRKNGWQVIRIWEHWTKKNRLPSHALKLLKDAA